MELQERAASDPEEVDEEREVVLRTFWCSDACSRVIVFFVFHFFSMQHSNDSKAMFASEMCIYMQI